MADTNYTIENFWDEYSEELTEATKGFAKEEAKEYAVEFATKQGFPIYSRSLNFYVCFVQNR